MVDILSAYGTLIAFVALYIDMSFQIARIFKRKSSADISIGGVVVRLSATLLFLFRFVAIRDFPLSLGQGLFCAMLAVYVFLLVKYRKG
jgi:uncharacterized protein with PQ loop repeat